MPSYFTIGTVLTVFLLASCGKTPSLDLHSEDDLHSSEDHHAYSTTVQLDSVSAELAGISIDSVINARLPGITVTGNVSYDANRVSHMGSRTEGRVTRLLVDIGSSVAAGQTMVVLESPLVGHIRAEETEAEAMVRITQENFEREKVLAEQGVSSRKELLASETEFRKAEAALKGARQRLQALGAGAGQAAEFVLVSPFAGTVVEKHVSLGEMVSPSDQLFTVADLSELWVELDIFERDIGKLSEGQSVIITAQAFPGQTFKGTIFNIGAIVDTVKRTLSARVAIANGRRLLKPGMFVTAGIELKDSDVKVPVVPQSAVQTLNGETVVFVPGSKSGEFRAVPVKLGERVDADNIVILSPLVPGDRIVVSGSFSLRAELSKAEIGEHSH